MGNKADQTGFAHAALVNAVLIGEFNDELGFGFTDKAGDLGGGAEVPNNGVADLEFDNRLGGATAEGLELDGLAGYGWLSC